MFYNIYKYMKYLLLFFVVDDLSTIFASSTNKQTNLVHAKRK